MVPRMQHTVKPQHNHLLAALSPEAFSRLAPDLEHVNLPLGKALYESGDSCAMSTSRSMPSFRCCT